MRIGIITMHRIPNYGSIMQALSLKRMMESLGHQVSFVDYRIQPEVGRRNDFREVLICWLKSRKRALKSTNMNINEVWHTRNKLLEMSEKYVYRKKVDVLVIGSDEVFNCLQPGYNVGYSLDLFGKNSRAKKIITYAASFGNTTLFRLQQYGVDREIGALLSRMEAISVRDENSEEIVHNLCGRKPYFHLDPVLVGNLEKDEWRVPELQDYVVMYGYHNRFTLQECEQIMEFAHKKGKTVIALGEDQQLRDRHILCSPEEIFGYFKKADYVFTDTFHGTIFSVVTHKPFLTIVRPGSRGNYEKLSSLAKTLGITDRFVESFVDVDNQMEQSIDFHQLDVLREEERNKAMKYLAENLS